MKNSLRNKTAILAIICVLLFSGCNQKHAEMKAKELYTCPMHPQIVQSTAGTCPVCGMDLVRQGRPGETIVITKDLANLLRPTNTSIVSSIRTVMPVEQSSGASIEAKGIITYDTRSTTDIAIRFNGRIEKLMIEYNFQTVRTGQKIAEIYSPELVTVQRELLYLMKEDSLNQLVIDAVKRKLTLFGLSNEQLKNLQATRKEIYSFPVFSPVNGYIIETSKLIKKQNEAALEAGSMNAGEVVTMPQGESKGLAIREGEYVTQGQSLFKVVNGENVWAEFNIYQQDAAGINLKDEVEISLDNNVEQVKAKVDFIQPFIASGENFTRVRSYLRNTNGKYHVGQLLNARVISPSHSTLVVPAMAVLDLGSKKIVFVKRKGTFRAREVETGKQVDSTIEIISGIDKSDSVAYQAQFLIDSESFINVPKKN